MDNSPAPGVADFIYDIRPIEAISVPGVAVRASFNVAAYRDELYPLLGIALPAHLGRAVVKRKAEFLSGRFLASMALQQVFGQQCEIGIGEHRQPLWPPGIGGSISHSSNAVACLVSAGVSLCLGIDIETVVSPQTANNIAASVVCDRELELLGHCPQAFPLCLTAVFSAKETLFKALYPRVGFYFDFKAALVTAIDLSQGSIVLELTCDLGPVHRVGDQFQIGILLETERVLSYLVCAVTRR